MIIDEVTPNIIFFDIDTVSATEREWMGIQTVMDSHTFQYRHYIAYPKFDFVLFL